MKKYLAMLLLGAFIFSCKPATESASKAPKAEVTASQEVPMNEPDLDPNINAKTAKVMLAQNRNIKVIDVRTPEETKEGTYDSALLIDFKADDFQKNIGELNKADTYIVYCRSGNRSGQAVSHMLSQGFKNVFNMEDGYDAFVK